MIAFSVNAGIVAVFYVALNGEDRTGFTPMFVFLPVNSYQRILLFPGPSQCIHLLSEGGVGKFIIIIEDATTILIKSDICMVGAHGGVEDHIVSCLIHHSAESKRFFC